jgi:hypothetical protein
LRARSADAAVILSNVDFATQPYRRFGATTSSRSIVLAVTPAALASPINAGEHDIGCGHLSVQNLQKVVTRLDVPLYIHEEVAGRELVLQPLMHRLGKAGIIIASAVVDEDLAGHLPLPLWQAFSNT